MTRWLLPACLVVALVATACEAPPNKEMDQAQGAIDAARAAGAEDYATTEFSAATDTLARSHQAAADRDYRLALNNALESREHAQNAARGAADAKAELRGAAERTMVEIAVLLTDADARLRMAETARVPARALVEPREALVGIVTDLQEVDEALKAGSYLDVGPRLDALKPRVEALIADLDARIASQSTRRRGTR